MAGKKGFGSKISYRTSTGPDVFVEIANVTKIRPFGIKVDIIDVTAMDSPSEYREKVSGLIDPGQAMFDINYDDKATTHKWLQDNAGGAVKHFKFTGPGAAPRTAEFDGIIVEVSPEVNFDGKMTAQVTIEVTSVITWADAA